MTLLLDTHFLVWILLRSSRLDRYSWLENYQPWGVSPASLLEVQFLSEIGRIELKDSSFFEVLRADPRFMIDEPPFLALVRQALDFTWTRDPFDRLLAAHSSVRRVPLCTLDQTMRDHHKLIPRELSTRL